MTEYRYDIGISKYPYGVEIEFMNTALQVLNEKFKEASIPSELVIDHKKSNVIYEKNYLDKDNTVTYEEDGIIYGGEISSRLYKNRKKDWEELEKICKILIENNAEIKGNCSNHINIEISKIKQKNRFLEALTKIIADYEQEIETFYMGDYFFERETKFYYAYSLKKYLRNLLDFLDFTSDCEWEINKIIIPTFEKHAGISLVDYNEKKRIEIRYPNGTLNKKIIQNNINFSLKLIDALAIDKFDLKEILREIKRHSNSMTVQEHLERFTYLVRTISSSSADENDFMSQYEKVLSKKTKIR